MGGKHPVLPSDFDQKSFMEKKRYLESNADRIQKDQTVLQPIADAEKQRLRFKLQELSISLSDKQKKYKKVQQEWRDDINEVKEALGLIIDQLKTGHKEVEGDLYEIRDYENERVHIFTAEGIQVDDRRMLPDERQGTMQSEMRKIK